MSGRKCAVHLFLKGRELLITYHGVWHSLTFLPCFFHNLCLSWTQKQTKLNGIYSIIDTRPVATKSALFRIIAWILLILLCITLLYKNVSVIKRFVLRKLVCFLDSFCMLLLDNKSFCCHSNVIPSFDTFDMSSAHPKLLSF